MTRVALIALAVVAVAGIQTTSAYEKGVLVHRQPGGRDGSWAGSMDTKPGQFPHQAAILIGISAFCGGSLISRTHVLTAGHCIHSYDNWAVILGAHKIGGAQPDKIVLFTGMAVVHEQYEPTFAIPSNDIGIITLPRAVDLGARINTIPLPPRSFQKEDFAGETGRVSGWGRTNNDFHGVTSAWPRYTDLKLISTEACRAVYGDVITNTKYCCKGVGPTYPGDSGAALTIGSGDNYTLIGIVSFSPARGYPSGLPVGFTAAPFFVDWISQKTGIPVRD